MKKKSSLVITLIFICCSCHDDKETTGSYRGPLVLEAKGYVVPEDSMAVPKVIPVDENKLKRIQVGKPHMVLVSTNIHVAGAPRVTPAGPPEINTPGTGIFALPKIIPAINHPSIALNPEIVTAKEMAGKDQNPASFSYFGRLQGLWDNLVTSIVEDKSGNLWFGTNAGVTKYDGKSFTNYNEKQGLLNDIIWSILEDKDGNFWFGSNGGGVSRYDGKSFIHYTEKEGLSNNSVSSILEDKSGNLWFGTYGGGVNKYDGKSFTHYTNKEGLSNNTVLSILEDKKGNLWFGTNGGGVSKFDGKSFLHYTGKEGLSNDTVLSILEDKNSNLWFGTNGGGVNKYDGKFFINYTDKEGLSDNRISSILEDKSRDLWFGSTGGGLSKYDGKSFTHYTEKEGLPNNHVTCIFEDNSSNLWVGSHGGGVSKYNGKSFTHYIEKEGLSSSPVFSILKDKNGNLWFGKDGGGVSKFDGKFFVNYTEREGLPGNNITCMLEDKSGNLWFGSGGGGVSKYDGKYFTRFTEKEGLNSNRVWCMFEDSGGKLWFGTWGSGASKYDGKSFTHYTEREGLSNNIVVSIFEDKNKNLWFGTRGGGACKFDGKSFTRFTQKEGMSNNNVGSIFEDKSGNLWFGTWGGGISKYDGKSFTHYNEKEGLSGNDVVSILQDKNGNLWFGTTKGISYLPLSRPAVFPEKIKSDAPGKNDVFFKNFTYADGFLGIAVNIGKTMIEDQHGDIWIGANDRLTVLHPIGLTIDTGAVNIHVNNIELFNENINWTILSNRKDSSFILANGIRVRHSEFDSLKRWYNVPEHLSLAYDNNYLTFHYIGITTHRPRQVKYQYILEGLDKNWSGVTNRTEATYGNLSHGSYTFKVKAMNSEGVWSNEYVYSFTIRPPWWKTLWAYTLYIVFFVAAVSSFIAYRSRKLRLENKILEEKVSQRTIQLKQKSTELEKSLDNLKSTQAQLIQSEKMASLGELTAGIAHEIQNPLNFVNNFSEVNTELIDELGQEVDKGNLDEVKAIAKDIKENEEKINHHGKRADAIVKGMLQHSQSSSGLKEPTDVNALADEYLRLSYHGFRAKDKSFNVTIQTDFDNSIGKINIVSQDIGRVLLNLYNNSFYAVYEKKKSSTDAYEPAVSVSTKKIGEKIEIKVRDNGNGVPSKIIDKIFQPFFTTKPTGQGTGLGLSLSFDIVKAHGGELTVITEEGKYSEFLVSLPI